MTDSNQTVEDVDNTTPTANSGVSTSGLRQAISAWLGESDYQKRDIYETFDWPRRPDAEQFYALYVRNPFAKPVVDRPAFTSWRDPPLIKDDDVDEETQFEEDVEKVARAHDLWSYGERVDRLAGIGRYGLLVFVTADIESPDDLAEEAPDTIPGDGADKITQIKVFSEVSVDEIDWGTIADAGDGRWGKPVSYTVDFSPEAETEQAAGEATYKVHHSRAVAVPASRLLDDDQFARPRLEIVMNALKDIEKVMGSIAELAYRGADKGLAVNFDPEKVDTSGQSWDDLEEELQDWQHGLQPLLRLVGANNVQQLGGEVADASGIFGPQLSALSAATNIPKRVFEGDPAGALASAEEDTQAYFGYIQERRKEFVTPHIVRPILDWLEENGVVSESTSDYVGIDWAALRVLSEQEKAELAATKAEWIPQAVTVREIRKAFDMEPQPEWMADEIANSYLSEVGGGQAGAGAALDSALAANQRQAEAAARTEARIQRGTPADD